MPKMRSVRRIVRELYYYNARFYNPDLGRFVTEDTYIGKTTDPMSLNRYIYARVNPES